MKIIRIDVFGHDKYIACAIPLMRQKNKKPFIKWKDTRETGGIYNSIEEFKKHIVVENSNDIKFVEVYG